jgi:hypothetical protein
MLRFFVIIFNFLGILFLNNIFNGAVSVKVDVQKVVVAGNDIKVQITLNKGKLETFSRFQMDLPAGLTATSDNSAYGDFSFEEKKVRFVWLRLPAQDEITISYIIHFDERLKGTFNLGGRFSYLENNERKFVDVDQQLITINPSPKIDPSLVVDIADFEKLVVPDLTNTPTQNVACIRQKPDLSKSDNEIVINLLVCKQNKEKFAKIEELVPAGYKALAIDTKDAIFTFKDNVVKFLWMNLPAESYFIVSYKLIPETVKKTDELNLKGQFSFIQDDKTYNVNIVEQNINLSTVKKEDIRNLVKSTKQQAGKNVIVAQNNKKDKGKTPAQNTNNASTAVNYLKDSVKVTQLSNKSNIANDISDLLEPGNGIYYRIQLAAGHKRLNVKQYFKKFKLNEQVKAEEHQGWRKYSVGSFQVYKDARDYRVHIWNTTTITDAFVAAYNDGKRITVQEALMVANQKWYK